MSKINLADSNSNGSVQEKLKVIMNFDKIINSSLDGLWIADENGKILQVNQVGLKLYDLSPNDVIYGKDTFFDISFRKHTEINTAFNINR